VTSGSGASPSATSSSTRAASSPSSASSWSWTGRRRSGRRSTTFPSRPLPGGHRLLGHRLQDPGVGGGGGGGEGPGPLPGGTGLRAPGDGGLGLPSRPRPPLAYGSHRVGPGLARVPGVGRGPRRKRPRPGRGGGSRGPLLHGPGPGGVRPVLLVYLLGVTAWGAWLGRNQRGGTDYFLGNRDLPWGAVLLSVVATETSTLTFLSIPGVAYLGNLAFLQLTLGYLVGRIVVSGDPPAGLLPGRAHHGLRTPGAAVRDGGPAVHLGDLHDHPAPGGLGAALRHRHPPGPHHRVALSRCPSPSSGS
jgi:hypothetical protein